MPTAEKVRLRHAFQWQCPRCGLDHFHSGVPCEMTPEDSTEMAAMYGGMPGDFTTGDWYGAPDEVTCPHCEVDFATEDPDEDESEDDDDDL